MSDQRVLFTQATSPAGSPYGAPPAPMAPPPAAAGGAYGAPAQSGHLGAGQQGTPYATPGYPAPPAGGAGYTPTQFAPQPSPPPAAAGGAGAGYTPTPYGAPTPVAPTPVYPPEKAQYQPGWQEQGPTGGAGGYADALQQQPPKPEHQASMGYVQPGAGAPGPGLPQIPPAGGAVSQQPGATAPMNPMATGGQYDAKGERDWKYGLFDCFADCGTCCLATWVPCIVYGKNKTRIDSLNNSHRVHPTGGEASGTDCLVHGALTICLAAGWVLQIGQRERTRGRYRIRGDGCSDCCAAFCCTPCQLVQEHREILDEERALQAAGQPRF